MSGPRLSIIPAGAIFDRSLEPRDLHVLNLLGCHTDKAGWCRRSQVRMAHELDCSRSSVQRSLDRLCEAGWVQKKRPPWSSEEGQPSNSYMYRVVLDRDDEPSIANSDDDEADAESHAETASVGGGCPQVGTPAQPDGHPGAQPYVGTGAHTYVGTKNDPLERPPLERERDARARADRTARFLVDFEKRWPTAAVDDRQRTAYAAEALTEDEQAAALQAIGPFLQDLAKKRGKSSRCPAGWKYLEQKRWTLLDQAAASGASLAASVYAPDSSEAKAIRILHDIVGRTAAFFSIWRRADGVRFSKPMTSQFAALALAPPADQWPVLNHQQAGAWEGWLRTMFDDGMARQRLRDGSRAPWYWPPKADGALYTSATGPPETLLAQGESGDDLNFT